MSPEAARSLADFLRQLGLERNLSAHTSSNYGRDLAALVKWCDQQHLADWHQLDQGHVRAFAARSHAGGLAPRSIQRRLSALRSFFRYLQREGITTKNPGEDVRAPKSARRLPRALDADQMGQLLEAPTEGPLGARDQAIMELL